MKKALPYILMVLTIVNLFAPFSVGVQRGNINVQKNVANAAGVIVTGDFTPTDTSVTGYIKVVWTDSTFRADYGALVEVKNQATGQEVMPPTQLDLTDVSKGDPRYVGPTNGNDPLTQVAKISFPATPSTVYTVNVEAIQATTSWLSLTEKYFAAAETLGTTLLFNTPDNKDKSSSSFALSVTTNLKGDSTPAATVRGQAVNADALMPSCTLGDWTVGGCVGQLLYYLFFVPTSFLFGLAGKFFDWTFGYSVSDTSYRSTFVVQGWGIVRDFCNMFFIFVLLYIAFATILDIGGHFKPRGMIITVVLVGLFINFSLFTTQVIIDSSNILARVFYSNSAIKVCANPGASGCSSTDPGQVGSNGEIQLSAALVNKVNPQNLLINASRVGVIDDKTGAASTSGAGQSTSGVSGTTFILVVLLATAVNVVGMIVFLMTGLIFVSRVIGLWFAMIFSPLMFFSYTVPGLDNMELFGNKKWWPETLKLAFLAPVFIFFLYLILKFLNTGLDLIGADGKTGIDFVMAITIPFIFIMVLLWKAKGIASDMSGKMGQSITSGIATVGGLALGGAALGAAFVGRQTAGAVSKNIQNDGARKNALKFKDTTDAWEAAGKKPLLVRPFAYLGAAGKAVKGVGKFAAAGVAEGIHKIPTGEDADGNKKSLGQRMQDESKKVGAKAHALHALDEAAQAMKHDKNTKFKDLTEGEQNSVKNKIDRDIIAKETYNKPYEKLDRDQRQIVDEQKGDYDNNGNFIHNPDGSFAAMATVSKNAAHARGEHVHTADEMVKDSKASTAISEFVNALRKGSYDVRNLSQTKSISGGMAKAGIGIISAVAAGVRTGLKASNINHGSGQGEFIKDLGHTITEAMKSAKVNVKVEESHGHSAHEAEHGGDHGGGGHH